MASSNQTCPIPKHKVKTAPMPKTLDSGASPKELAIQVGISLCLGFSRWHVLPLLTCNICYCSRHQSGSGTTGTSLSSPNSARTQDFTPAPCIAT